VNPLLLFGGGAAVAYLLLRTKNATAATTPAAPTNTGMPLTSWPLQAPQAPAPIGISASTPTAPQTPPGTKPPQITTPAPPFPGEVPAPKPMLQLTGRWGWPVPRWQGRSPVISDGFGSPRPPGTHMGVDLMFGRISSDPFPIGPNGSKAFVMPDAWMAVAASDGVLWSAERTPRGFAVVIDHGNVATFYQHLEVLLVPEAKPPAKGSPKDTLIQIKAGQPLGVIGADPLDPSHLKHLHFELWPGGPASAIDPQALMKSWQVFTPDDVAPFLQALRRNAAKKRPPRRPDLIPVRAYERRWSGTSLNPSR
jgi:murein DD-endopeptidase MepM/ murein hydrolase activator NlpD